MTPNSLIIVPFHLPWNWSADYQRQTCLELAKKHIVVAYLNNDARFFLKSRPPIELPAVRNVVFFQPRYVLPMRRFALVEKLNQLLCLWYIFLRYGSRAQKKILWIFDPIFWFYPLLRRIYPAVISLYDCVDFMWSRDKASKKKTQKMEKTLIKNVDYFFVNSHVLHGIHKKQRLPNATVPQGFRLDQFKETKKIPQKRFRHDKPIVGYVGAINHRLDFRLLRTLARQNPAWRFVLWGNIQETDDDDYHHTRTQVQKLSTLPNVVFGKSRSPQETAAVIREFDVAIIPYIVRYEGVKYSYPMKLFEYFYFGKPVVSTNIIELHRFGKFVKVTRTGREFEKFLRVFIETRWSIKKQTEQRAIAIENSWEHKVSKILDHVV